MDVEYQVPPQESGPQPHPYLHEPLLYISNVPTNVTDETLGMAFMTCAPFRPRISRDSNNPVVSGTIEFKFQDKAEKALATLQSRPIPGLNVPLVLSPYPPTNPPTPLPPPSALPRLVKHLPPAYGDSNLYDLFRPFGALASARTQTHFGPDTGMVEFWNEDDARRAEEAMHCADVEGQNIAVQVYQPRRAPPAAQTEFNTNAPTFVPSGAVFSYPGTTYSPPRQHYSPRSPVSPLGGAFVHGPGQQVQLAPPSGPGSNSHSGLIDPCNLFCKNLDPEIDSNALFSHFRQYGQIVSARVMRNENGESRGFGFVSFQTPDQAATAMHAMNNVMFGSKQVVVRLHEPKQLRQEKLAARFGSGGNGHPRTASGATSPTASEGGDSWGGAGWGSPSPRNRTLGLGGSPGNHYERPDRGRRGSGSYYNAAYTGTLNIPMRYDDLAALSPVVRKEVLTGELSRRIKALPTPRVPAEDVDSIVEQLINVSLSEIVQAIEDPQKLAQQVQNIHQSTSASLSASPSPARSPSASASHASQDSRLLDPNALAATASAPEHPSTPISVPASLSAPTPPRTSSPSGSLPPITSSSLDRSANGSERDRMAAAVSKLEASAGQTQATRADQLTDLLMSLPKRERAMCLFNVEVLRAKLADAKEVLESMEDEEGEETTTKIPPPSALPPSTPQGKGTMKVNSGGSPQTPDLSSRGPSATASPLPATPSASSTASTVTAVSSGAGAHTITSLARLPAAEIVRLLSLSSSSTPSALPAGLTPADPLVVQATDAFIDSLMDKPPQTQKQQLGDKLFKVVKGFGVKSAPKVTIALLDGEDLRALAHLMNEWPGVLREKAGSVVVGK